VGKCLLAFSGKKGSRNWWKNKTKKICSRYHYRKKALQRHLQENNSKKYAVDCQELEMGLICLGVSVLIFPINVWLVIIVSVPEVRFNFELSGAKEKVQAVAGEISLELQGK